MLRRLYDTIVGRSDEGAEIVTLASFIFATETSALSVLGDWRNLVLPATLWTIYGLTRAGTYLQNRNEQNGIIKYR